MNAVNPAYAGILFAAGFLVTAIGVAVFTRLSLRRGLFDIPNERSSHSTPTPRGGGLIIVLVSLAGYAAMGWTFGLPISWGYIVGALMVAAVSWLDDLSSLPFWARLIIHIAAALILILDVGFWSSIALPLVPNDIWLGNVVGILVTVGWLVWLLNAYNFMDGIDGLAALQAVIAGAAWAVLAWMIDLPAVFLFGGLLASSSAGFLLHNWQPAKIFMGDVGSAFLGFTLAAIPLIARKELKTEASMLPVVAVLFVWFFVFDTVFTLIRRLLGGKRVWEAHREHIYQRMIIGGRRHATVTLTYGLAASLVALLVVLGWLFSGIYPVLAFLSLIVLTATGAYLGIRQNR
jgi:Fuc2NAc and GlcNAc transferase